MDLNLLYSSISNLPASAIIAIISSHFFLGSWGFNLGYKYRHNLELSHEAKRLREKDKSDELSESLKKQIEQNKLLEQKNSELLEEKNSLTFLLQQRDANRPIRSRPW